MKKININVKWIISFVISLAGFIFIEKWMIIQPDKVSGNGNLGLAVVILLFPIFIASYYFTFIQTRKAFGKLSKLINLCLLALCILLAGLLVFPIHEYVSNLLSELGGPPTVEDSRIYRFGWLNQYTNSIYFNIYTFSLTHLLVVIASISFALAKK